jgi:hypothetical protein
MCIEFVSFKMGRNGNLLWRQFYKRLTISRVVEALLGSFFHEVNLLVS